MQTDPRILASSDPRYPAGPRLLPQLLNGNAFFPSDPIAILSENARRYGDLVHFRALDGHVFQINHPALI